MDEADLTRCCLLARELLITLFSSLEATAQHQALKELQLLPAEHSLFPALPCPLLVTLRIAPGVQQDPFLRIWGPAPSSIPPPTAHPMQNRLSCSQC